MDYEKFLASKTRSAHNAGVNISEDKLNPMLMDFQRAIVKWGIRNGRPGLYEDCGLGKTFQSLEYASQLIENGHAMRAIVLCPIAVANQVVGDAVKFNIKTECRVVSDSSEVKSGINVTNYQKLHKFDLSAFDIVILNEASILKNEHGKIRNALNESFKDFRFRLAETATPAPNDYTEIGTQSEFLGWMDNEVMKSMFFIHDGGDTSKWRLRKHGVKDYWNWVASWSVAIARPSSIGFSDEGYDLPELKMHEHMIESGGSGWFNVANKVSATNVHKEKRASIERKSHEIATIVGSDNEPCVIWVDTDYEGDAVLKVLPDAIEVRGSQSPEKKEELLSAFTNGQIKTLVTKAKIGGFGLNWQHCNKTVFMANYSFEQWYQLIRRFYRFGQKRSVNAHMIFSENETGIVQSLKRKQDDFEKMTIEMSEAMRDGMERSIFGREPKRKYVANQTVDWPSWS